MEETEIVDIKSELKKPETIPSLTQDTKNENLLIKTAFLLMNAFFAIMLISLYMFYAKGYAIAYRTSPELAFATIIISIRSVIMLSLAYYMFRKWYAQEKRYLKNIPFLVGLFFYFVAIGKFMDLLVYIHHSSPYFNEGTELYLIKLRYLFLVITFLPMLFLGLRPIIYNYGLNHGWEDKKVLGIRKTIIGAYAFGFWILIITAPNIYVIQIILGIMSIFTYITIWYIFRFAHKNNTFPTIRSDIVSLGFLLYLIFSPSRVIFRYFFEDILTLEIVVIIPEVIDFIVILIIFLGFVLKPK